MLKRIMLILILICLLPSFVVEAKIVDSRGYHIDGHLRSYDEKAKKDKFYRLERMHRDEMRTGISEEEWDEIDKGEPSS